MVAMAQGTLKNRPENSLAKKLSSLTGIGEKTTQLLNKSRIATIFDLLLHVPKSVVTQENSPGFKRLETGRRYIVEGKVVAVKVSGMGQRRRLEGVLEDKTGRLSVVFFGPAVNYAQQILKNDATVTLSGEVKDFLGRPQMVHPKLVTSGRADFSIETNIATYSQINGLTSQLFKRIVDKALQCIVNDKELDHLPDSLLKAHQLSSLKEAFCAIHKPGKKTGAEWDDRAKSPHFRRLAFEELLSFYVRLYLERKLESRKAAYSIETADVDALTAGVLPFDLTGAQRRVIEEIIKDLREPCAMTRLLQGDVGSGKTAVSAIVALHAASSGLQVAVMAPTEILAEQLFNNYQAFFKEKPLKIALLTSGTKTKARKILREQIESQEISILVGTHALLSEDIKFKKLGLLIVDEQHRFGVKQRADLIEECGKAQGFSPHLLVMSATPIPRSLALTLYGDLDLSVLDERPKGRLPIHTQILAGPVLSLIDRVCERIIATKQKAFIVFPLVEESEMLDLENAKKALTVLKEKFGDGSTLLLHGKMKAEEKAKTMADFRNGEISFLVATTVVEVGVDIPDATCMVIAHPERFGLAQLHQLRGRVGRKDLKSYCFLITDIKNRFSTAFKRLDAMCQTDNGFKLAEIDLEIRGPGELLGTKQSGLPNFTLFNHSDFQDLALPAKIQAKTISDAGLTAAHEHLYLNKSAYFS